MKGINIILVEESYTSKTSFIDREKLFKFIKESEDDFKKTSKSSKPESYQFVGKRIKRGLFKTKENKLINADVNGAYNILRKVFGDSVYHLIELNSIGVSHPSKYCCV